MANSKSNTKQAQVPATNGLVNTVAQIAAAPQVAPQAPVRKPAVAIAANVPAGSAAALALAAGIAKLPASNPAITGNVGNVGKRASALAPLVTCAPTYRPKAGQNAVWWEAMQACCAANGGSATVAQLVAACGSAAFVGYVAKHLTPVKA